MTEQQKQPPSFDLSTPTNVQKPLQEFPKIPGQPSKSGGGSAPSSDKDRPDLLLSVDPDKASFRPSGSRSEHMVVNLGKTRAAVKVRCSDNSLYRVNPVYMFINAGECCNLVVTRLPGPPKDDKLVLQYMTCTGKDTGAKHLFATANPTRKLESLKITLTVIAKDDAPSIGGGSATSLTLNK